MRFKTRNDEKKPARFEPMLSGLASLNTALANTKNELLGSPNPNAPLFIEWIDNLQGGYALGAGNGRALDELLAGRIIRSKNDYVIGLPAADRELVAILAKNLEKAGVRGVSVVSASNEFTPGEACGLAFSLDQTGINGLVRISDSGLDPFSTAALEFLGRPKPALSESSENMVRDYIESESEGGKAGADKGPPSDESPFSRPPADATALDSKHSGDWSLRDLHALRINEPVSPSTPASSTYVAARQNLQEVPPNPLGGSDASKPAYFKSADANRIYNALNFGLKFDTDRYGNTISIFNPDPMSPNYGHRWTVVLHPEDFPANPNIAYQYVDNAGKVRAYDPQEYYKASDEFMNGWGGATINAGMLALLFTPASPLANGYFMLNATEAIGRRLEVMSHKSGVEAGDIAGLSMDVFMFYTCARGLGAFSELSNTVKWGETGQVELGAGAKVVQAADLLSHGALQFDLALNTAAAFSNLILLNEFNSSEISAIASIWAGVLIGGRLRATRSNIASDRPARRRLTFEKAFNDSQIDMAEFIKQLGANPELMKRFKAISKKMLNEKNPPTQLLNFLEAERLIVKGLDADRMRQTFRHDLKNLIDQSGQTCEFAKIVLEASGEQTMAGRMAVYEARIKELSGKATGLFQKLAESDRNPLKKLTPAEERQFIGELREISVQTQKEVEKARDFLKTSVDKLEGKGSAANASLLQDLKEDCLPDLASRAERIHARLQDLDNYTNFKKGLYLIKTENTDIGKLCQQVANDAKSEAINLVFDISPRACMAKIDVSLLREALHNVVSNAFKYAKSVVTVRIYAEGSEVLIKVENDVKPGMALRNEQEADNAFGGIANPNATSGSTGFGLPTSRLIIEKAFAGKIRFSELGNDGRFGLPAPTTVEIRLPLAKETKTAKTRRGKSNTGRLEENKAQMEKDLKDSQNSGRFSGFLPFGMMVDVRADSGWSKLKAGKY
ncbi:MAG: HAMP domain-containing sensor histidine kinase, partial [Candidatus Micrarchaeota archaeon]